jgi:hypothetical protein
MIYGNKPPSAFYKMRINRIKAAELTKRANPQQVAFELPERFMEILRGAAPVDEPALDKTKLN